MTFASDGHAVWCNASQGCTCGGRDYPSEAGAPVAAEAPLAEPALPPVRGEPDGAAGD